MEFFIGIDHQNSRATVVAGNITARRQTAGRDRPVVRREQQDHAVGQQEIQPERQQQRDEDGRVVDAQVHQEEDELAHEVAEEVKSSGESVKLRPMNAFERKVIHDTIQEIGLTSESEGEDPNRCVVVLPATSDK